MDVVAYLRILRRHWRMIAVAAVIGAIIGVGSTVVEKQTGGAQSSGRYYKAAHTLFLDTTVNSDSTYRPVFTNLDQMAVLATTGDVPQRVADELGGDAKELATHIYVTTNGTLSTIELSAADRSPQVAVQLADSFAKALTDSIQEKEQKRLDDIRDTTLKRLNDLQAQIAALDAQIAAKQGDLSIITAQRNSSVNSYTATYEKFQGIANASDPTSNLSTLQGAEPERISKGEYDTLIRAGQLGTNRVRGDYISNAQPDGTAPAASSSSTRLNGPVPRGFLGALLGFLIGIGLALVADRVDRRLRTRVDFEASYGMPVWPRSRCSRRRNNAASSSPPAPRRCLAPPRRTEPSVRRSCSSGPRREAVSSAPRP